MKKRKNSRWGGKKEKKKTKTINASTCERQSAAESGGFSPSLTSIRARVFFFWGGWGGTCPLPSTTGPGAARTSTVAGGTCALERTARALRGGFLIRGACQTLARVTSVF